MDKYSVLMSLYKNERAEYFRLAIESMIHQTIPPKEIVLVKDGPLTKELDATVLDYTTKYPGLINVVKNDINMGLGLALQKGVLACNNELIVRMDTDDISLNNRCEKQLRFMENHPEVSIVGGQIDEFCENPHNIVGRRRVPLNDKELKKYAKIRCPFNHMTVMFRKKAVLEAGNYRDWHYNEDYDLWIRMLMHNAKFANLDVVLVKVRVGEEMYSRRGGITYYRSEKAIQRFMLNNHVINYPTYLINCGKRWILQVMLPNSVRGWVYQKFARV